MIRRLIAACVIAACPLTAFAGVVEVKLKLPLKPKVVIGENDKITIAPFAVIVDDESAGNRSAKVDVQAEFARYLRKQLAKNTKLQLVDPGAVQLPGSDIKALAEDKDFWIELARRTGSDLVISGVIDFDIEDKAGYRTEEYVSPVDGRTYYRQVLVESTGFIFDIVVAIFDGETGEKLLEENFRDFKEFDQRSYDEILGLFENLRSLETQLLSIFVAQETPATRFLFND